MFSIPVSFQGANLKYYSSDRKAQLAVILRIFKDKGRR